MKPKENNSKEEGGDDSKNDTANCIYHAQATSQFEIQFQYQGIQKNIQSIQYIK